MNDYSDVQYLTTSAQPTSHKSTETPSLRDDYLVSYDAKEEDDCELLAV